MITVDINVFRKDLKKYLSTPCQVTRYGTPIASIVPTGALEIPPIPKKIKKDMVKLEKILDEVAGTATPAYTTQPVIEPKVVPFTLNKAWNIWVCPHNNESGQCPLGCIRGVK
jgi:hypothetical protein